MTRLAPPVSEKEWQGVVVELAEILGWSWVHVPTVLNARKDKRAEGGISYRYKTAAEGPLGKGWTDLLLARERVIYAELKIDGKYPTPEQREVHETLRAAGGEVYVWTPSMLNQVRDTLTRRGAP